MTDQNQRKEEVTREEDFATQIGIGRDTLRELRQKVLTEGSGWLRRGKEIVLTATGMSKVLATLKLPSAQEQGSSAPSRPQDAPKTEVLCVVSLPRNPRLLMASNAAGTVLRVRVKDTRKFVIGMEVHARCVQGDLYEHSGRLPRYRGRY